MDGLIFGFVDNAVLIFGAFTGYEVEKYLPAKMQTGFGAVYGAAIGNTISDGLGAIIDPTMHAMITGVIIGCLIPIVVIPIITKYIKGAK